MWPWVELNSVNPAQRAGGSQSNKNPSPLSSFTHQPFASVSTGQTRVEAREQRSPGASPGEGGGPIWRGTWMIHSRLCVCAEHLGVRRAVHTLLDCTYDIYSGSCSGRGESQDSEVKSLAPSHSDLLTPKSMFFPCSTTLTRPCSTSQGHLSGPGDAKTQRGGNSGDRVH